MTYISWSRDFALYLWQYLTERHRIDHLSKQRARQVVRGQPFLFIDVEVFLTNNLYINQMPRSQLQEPLKF